MAQDTLGDYSYEGKIVSQNYAKAVELYTKAAQQGISSALFNLGYMLLNGVGVPQTAALLH
ncbi:sel1 repeat family protein [archaeon]|nr:MAG: sel1 repeat family protein [archaeon]